jgi:hypothetical protein
VRYLTEFFEVFENYPSKIPLTPKEIEAFSNFWIDNLGNQIQTTHALRKGYSGKTGIEVEVKNSKVKKFILKNSKELEIRCLTKLLDEKEKPHSILHEERNNNDGLQYKMLMQEEKMVDDDAQNNQSQSPKCGLLYFKENSNHQSVSFNAIKFNLEDQRTNDLPMLGIRIPSPSKMDFYKRENFEFLFLVTRLDESSKEKFQYNYLTECMRPNTKEDKFDKLVLSNEQLAEMSTYWDKFFSIHVENKKNDKKEQYTKLFAIEIIIDEPYIANLLKKEALKASIVFENRVDDEIDDEEIIDPFDNDMENNEDNALIDEMDEEKNIIYNATIDETAENNTNTKKVNQYQLFNKSKSSHMNHGNNEIITSLEEFKNKVPQLIEQLDPQLITDQRNGEDKSSTTVTEVMNHLKTHMSSSLYDKLYDIVFNKEEYNIDKDLVIQVLGTDLKDHGSDSIIMNDFKTHYPELSQSFQC